LTIHSIEKETTTIVQNPKKLFYQIEASSNLFILPSTHFILNTNHRRLMFSQKSHLKLATIDNAPQINHCHIKKTTLCRSKEPASKRF